MAGARFSRAMLTGSLTLVVAGCGDLPLCPSETNLLIDRTPVTIDGAPAAPGVQTDVVVQTTLPKGATVDVEVVDGANGVTERAIGTVDAEGTARITGVTVPSPRARLRAIAHHPQCGDATEEVEIDVVADGPCGVELDPAPVPSDFFAPLSVLDVATDQDPDQPGHQGAVIVTTFEGAQVEVFAAGPAGETSLGTAVATAAGARLDVTVPDGQVAVRATCTVGAATLASSSTSVVVDTIAPGCGFVLPTAGTLVTPELDLDGDLGNGVQLAVTGAVSGDDVAGEPVVFTVTEVGAAGSEVAGTPVDVTGATTATLTIDPAATPAELTFSLSTRDHAGNPCTTSADHAVSYTFVAFSAPALDGKLAAHDGSVNGGALTFPLCGTVSRDGAAVAVSIDGGPPVAATVTGQTWCVTATLGESPPAHELVATATLGSSTGTASLDVEVDITPPSPIADLGAAAVNRQQLRATWTAPSDRGGAAPAYVARLATVPLTDANFDVTGVPIPIAPPAAPGTSEALQITPVRTGTTFFVGIAAVDGFGNRSAAAVSGPLLPVFDQTGAIAATDPEHGTLALGSAIAHGRFNDDDFPDVAIGAPTRNSVLFRTGAVYVYFGGPSGIPAAPGLVIEGEIREGRFGSAVAALPNGTRDDLLVGAPGGDGQIFRYTGGPSFGTGVRTASSAEGRIRVDAATPGWFANAGLGARLATADFDGDGLQDLIASAPRGDGGPGGVVILYGDTLTLDVALSDLDPSGSGTTIVELIRDPGGTTLLGLGTYLFGVGATEGPTDTTDDLVVAYADNMKTVGESLYVFRGDGTRPLTPGVTSRTFAPARDVRIDLATTSVLTDWGAAAATIPDQDGDGARELVISAYHQGAGRTLILPGRLIGVVSTQDPGVIRTLITAGTGVNRFGAVIVGNDGRSSGDVDGDGLEDLLIGGVTSAGGRLFVWFGGAIPRGAVTASSAATSITLSPPDTLRPSTTPGPAGVATWIGDLNGDGLDDVCVGSSGDNAGDGLFEVLWDEAP